MSNLDTLYLNHNGLSGTLPPKPVGAVTTLGAVYTLDHFVCAGGGGIPGVAGDDRIPGGVCAHILNAPVGEDEAVLYRSTATLTPVSGSGGNTHDSREDRNATFARQQAPDDFEEPDNYDITAHLRRLDERRVGESLEIGRSGNTHNGERSSSLTRGAIRTR